MGGLFGGGGGLGKLAAPLPKSIDPVGNATSKALFGDEDKKQKQVAAAAAAENKPSTPSAGDALGIEDEEKKKNSMLGYGG